MHSNTLAFSLYIFYLLSVAAIGLVSLIGILLLHKHAEKNSLARAVSVVYAFLFLSTALFSLATLKNL